MTPGKRVIVDTTVQEKAIAHPTDARLLDVARQLLVRHAKRVGITLKQTYERECKALRRRAGGYAHAKQFKRLKTVLKRQRTILGVLIREIARKMGTTSLAEDVKTKLTTLSMAIEFSPPVVIQISPPGWESVLSAGRSSPALSFSLSR